MSKSSNVKRGADSQQRLVIRHVPDHKSARILNLLKRRKLLRRDGSADAEKVRRLLEKHPNRRTKNIGKKTENELRRMVGLPELAWRDL